MSLHMIQPLSQRSPSLPRTFLPSTNITSTKKASSYSDWSHFSSTFLLHHPSPTSQLPSRNVTPSHLISYLPPCPAISLSHLPRENLILLRLSNILPSSLSSPAANYHAKRFQSLDISAPTLQHLQFTILETKVVNLVSSEVVGNLRAKSLRAGYLSGPAWPMYLDRARQVKMRVS